MNTDDYWDRDWDEELKDSLTHRCDICRDILPEELRSRSGRIEAGWWIRIAPGRPVMYCGDCKARSSCRGG